jgi:cytidyltransferase-like protein
MIKKLLYNTIVLGGTFDHLHEGHKEFIQFAAEIGRFLIIGVTDQHMTLHKPNNHTIQPTHVRKQAVQNYCNLHKIKAKVITIIDPFGPTLERNKIQALACTKDTLAGADKINEIRDKMYLRELPIHIHTLKKDSQNLHTISAQRIRAGEIDRKGTVYLSILESDLELSKPMREYFSKLQCNLVTEASETNHSEDLRIVIGDTSLEQFITNGWQYDLGIFDGKRQRKSVSSDILDSLDSQKTTNKAGFIQTEATTKISDWFKNKDFKHLFVNGEEDLTAVIAILTAPLGTYIYYGQPNEGMVECIVSEDLKEEVYKILSLK